MADGALEFSLSPADNGRLANLCGAMDSNLKHIARALEVDIQRRGEFFRLRGDKPKTEAAARALRRLYHQAENSVGLVDVQLSIAEQLIENGKAADGHSARTESPIKNFRRPANSSMRRAVVQTQTEAQRGYLECIAANPITLAIGPAGTGKTFLAVFAAVRALASGEVERIVLVRPAVEAGERLGFLPGDMEQKVNPYLRPLYDALRELFGRREAEKRAERGEIEVAPLAFMRGRTLSHSFIILDEAQNTTPGQMKMMLTRMGEESRIVVNGDVTQIDLPRGQRSGLVDAAARLCDIDGIALVRFGEADVIRHPLVRRVLDAYEKS